MNTATVITTIDRTCTASRLLMIAHVGAGGLLHVVCNNGDGVVLLQDVDQLLDLGGGDRVECRAGLVEQDDLRLDGDGAGDAQPLLLAAGEAEAAGVELVLGLVPDGRAAQRVLDADVEIGFGHLLVKAHAEGDVIVDGHGKRRRLLEHHADLGAEQIDVLAGGEDVLAIEQDLAIRPLVRVEIVDAVDDTQ
jgi:hypothetical protein